MFTRIRYLPFIGESTKLTAQVHMPQKLNYTVPRYPCYLQDSLPLEKLALAPKLGHVHLTEIHLKYLGSGSRCSFPNDSSRQEVISLIDGDIPASSTLHAITAVCLDRISRPFNQIRCCQLSRTRSKGGCLSSRELLTG